MDSPCRSFSQTRIALCYPKWAGQDADQTANPESVWVFWERSPLPFAGTCHDCWTILDCFGYHSYTSWKKHVLTVGSVIFMGDMQQLKLVGMLPSTYNFSNIPLKSWFVIYHFKTSERYAVVYNTAMPSILNGTLALIGMQS